LHAYSWGYLAVPHRSIAVLAQAPLGTLKPHNAQGPTMKI
jgi:hypothetical protein